MANKLSENVTLTCCAVMVSFAPSAHALAAQNSYENDNWGFEFVIPDGVTLYTVDDPGPMASRIDSETPLWLVNSSLASERINVKVSTFQDATERELTQFKQQLDNGTLYRSVSGYQNIAVRFIEIGKNGNKRAIEHLHALEQSEPKRLRQVMFIHRGRLFNFTCATSPERFDGADEEFFDLIFRSLEFR